MEIIIVKIVLFAMLFSLMWHIIVHLLAVFCPAVTDMAVEEVNKDVRKYVRNEHFAYFLRNMVAFAIVVILLTTVFSSKIEIKVQKNSVGLIKHK